MTGTEELRISLSHKEMQFLARAEFLPPHLQKVAQRIVGEAGGKGISVTPAEAQELRAQFTEQLARSGFDDAYRLTSDGEVLEDLIDKFFPRI